MKFNKKKMKTYYQISALMFLLGGWRIYVVNTHVAHNGSAVLFSESDKLTSAYALLFFAFLFLVMGTLHALSYARKTKK